MKNIIRYVIRYVSIGIGMGLVGYLLKMLF